MGMQCPNCAAPMVQMIMSVVCSAECDLKPAKTTLDHWEAIKAWKNEQPIECVECLCGYQCTGRGFFWDGRQFWVRWGWEKDAQWTAVGSQPRDNWERYLIDFGGRHQWRITER